MQGPAPDPGGGAAEVVRLDNAERPVDHTGYALLEGVWEFRLKLSGTSDSSLWLSNPGVSRT